MATKFADIAKGPKGMLFHKLSATDDDGVVCR